LVDDLRLVRPRELRGAALIAAALVGVAVIAFAYLRPVMRPPYVTPPAAQITIQSWQFADSRNGWVAVRRQDTASGRSELFATHDGGGSWTRLSLQVPSAYVTWLRVFDADHGMVQLARDQSDGRGSLLGTDNGAATWHDLRLPDQPAVGTAWFLDRQHGWFLTQAASNSPQGTALTRTVDGGRTWQLLWRMNAASPDAGHGLPWAGVKGPLTFLTPERGFLAAAEPDGSLRLFGTGDGGADWSPIELPDIGPPRPALARAAATTEVQSFSASAVEFASVRLDEPARLQPVGWIFLSADQGRTWEARSLPDPGHPFRVQPTALLGEDRWWLADGRQLWTTSDGGQHWDLKDAALPGSAVLGSLQAANGGEAWSAGWSSPAADADALLLRTLDGGAHWSAVRLPRLG